MTTRAPDLVPLFLVSLLGIGVFAAMHAKGWKWAAAVVAVVVGLVALRRKHRGRQDDRLYATWQRQRWETAKRYERWPDA